MDTVADTHRETSTVDMLIHLSQLPPLDAAIDHARNAGLTIRRAMAYERRQVIDWVDDAFGRLWADESAVAFNRMPVGCHVAIYDHHLCGFCCVESTYRGFIGPIGLDPQHRRKGGGSALVLSALCDLRFSGHAYAIVGDVGTPEFFARVAGAVAIENSGSAYPEKMA